jgi:hypothetical protein
MPTDLKQTLDKKSDSKASADNKMSTWELLKYPGVGMVIYLYGHVMILAFSHTIGLQNLLLLLENTNLIISFTVILVYNARTWGLRFLPPADFILSRICWALSSPVDPARVSISTWEIRYQRCAETLFICVASHVSYVATL